jgi:radical SAM protein with 4Fe4S-binding SPASM domain
MQRLLDKEIIPFVDEHYFLPLYGTMAAQSEERAKELGFVPTAGNQGRLGALVKPLPCWALFNEGHIRVDGHVSACCFGADDKYDMGDLNKQSFMDAWHSKEFSDLRQAHLNNNIDNTVCSGCMAYT